MDVEALQAQIDLSNSIAYDLVSSWMKPSTSSSTESVSHAISRDLEEYAKRPPRLGLGATISKSSLATSHEAAKLKGKLVGQKRRRDEDRDPRRDRGAKMPHNDPDDDDESESRSAAISTKKIRVKAARGPRQGKPEHNGTTVSMGNRPAKGHQPLKLFPIAADVPPEASKPKHILPTAPPVDKPSPAMPRPSPSHHPPPSSAVSSQPVPLLNLHGPPMELIPDEASHPQDESAGPKKKKRKRKRRKNHGHEEAA